MLKSNRQTNKTTRKRSIKISDQTKFYETITELRSFYVFLLFIDIFLLLLNNVVLKIFSNPITWIRNLQNVIIIITTQHYRYCFVLFFGNRLGRECGSFQGLPSPTRHNPGQVESGDTRINKWLFKIHLVKSW